MPDAAEAENEQYPQKISPMQTPINSRPFLNAVIVPQRTSTLSPSDHILLNSPTMTSNSGSGTSETSPIGEIISTDLEGPDNERVMCMACRGVYPSRRSLTGHIGRNEKCREIIDIKYYNTIISGNIRRHINQCGKNESGQKRPRADKEQRKDSKRRRAEEELLPPILHEGFEPVPQIVAPPSSLLNCSPVMSPPMNSLVSSFLRIDHKSSELAQSQDNSLYSNNIGSDRRIQLPTDPSPPGVTRKDQEPPEHLFNSFNIYWIFVFNFHTDNKPLKESDSKNIHLFLFLKDAYICDHCEFVTIYKGNMKRHLNTCHPAPDCKDLKEWDRKLESMRASVLGISKENMIERLNAHKLNSTRGRKPRGKRQEEQQIYILFFLIRYYVKQMMPQEHSQMRYNYDMMSFPNL
uniref:C2H2-type domain-containing protein n=1 Tax=Heterorhabditis bacteriophora TaxID=37862 RepID=A0A1I7X0E9_HETBA